MNNKLSTFYKEYTNEDIKTYIEDKITKFKKDYLKTNPNATEEDINTYITNKTKYLKEDIITDNINKKRSLISKQIENYGAYIHFAETSKLKSSFDLPNMITYNDIIIDNFETFKKLVTLDNIKKYNYSEHIYLNESRIFFDIDFVTNDEESQEQLKRIIKGINWIKDTFNLDSFGVCEIKEIEYEEMIPDNLNLIVVTNENLKKCLSAHIFLNGWSERKNIKLFMNKYFATTFNLNGGIFDTSVYKTTKQSFRCSFSAKVFEGKVREIPEDSLKILLNNIDILYQSRVSPMEDDKYVDLSEYIKTTNVEMNSVTNEVTNGGLNDITNNNKIIYNTNDISIFQYIKTQDKIINLNDVYTSCNYYEFVNLLTPYLKTVLTPEEIEENIKNIFISQDNQNKFDTCYESWCKDKIMPYAKRRIQQDYSNIIPLYSLLSYNKEIIEPLMDKKELTQPEDEILKDCVKRMTIIKNYIIAYEKKNFLTHDFYKLDDLKYKHITKKNKILYNVCFIGENLYNVYESKFYSNITTFKRLLKISGETFKNIELSFISFEDYEEFKRIKAEVDVFKLDEDTKNNYNSKLLTFIGILKDTFKYEDDFKYYMSYFANKLTTKTTLNRGLINQGTESEAGQDAFKTFFVNMLDLYIHIEPCLYTDFNDRFSGAYLKGGLCVIEELPKDIKDVSNFINKIKSFTQTKTISINEKNIPQYKKDNTVDFIINTNHTVSKMFSNKNDCDALLKRFRIITRVSVKWEEHPELKEIINDITKNNGVYSYLLKEYLINNHCEYFKEHFKDMSEIMKLYQEISLPDSETNKAETLMSLKEFEKEFKENFIKNYKLRVRELYNYLKQEKAIELIGPKLFKQKLIVLLKEEEKLITVSEDKNREILITEDNLSKVIEKIYNQYFEQIMNDK